MTALDDLPEPWTDRDHPEPALGAAYRGGIIPPAERWQSDFIMPIGPATPLAAALICVALDLPEVRS